METTPTCACTDTHICDRCFREEEERERDEERDEEWQRREDEAGYRSEVIEPTVRWINRG